MNRFWHVILTLWALIMFSGLATAQPLPDCYHRLDELYNFIFQLNANDTLGIVHIDSIGHSRGDQLGHVYPIYAVKISDNADVFEDEPVMLVICNIHAEEVIGIELGVDYMTRLTSQYQQYLTLVNNTQIYFIPTMNPDGLQVISYGVPVDGDTLWDDTWRKNGYHPPQMGQASCNVAPGSGSDSCGVDLNRNFDINWIYGDTLWRPASTERFDYFRGPGPFSEPEDQAVRDFARQIHPSLSIVYHSSRSGRIAEQGIVAWQWGLDPGPYKFPPDCTAIWNINDPYCGLLPKFSDPGTYTRVFGGTHNGCLQDWFYQQLGCIQILTELGPGINIQPPCATLSNLITTDRESLEWMHRRLLNLNMSNQPAVLKIYTKDANTNAPISAEWRNRTTWTPIVGKWMTNDEFGRATFFPPLGPITIEVRKEGYVTKDSTISIGTSGSRTLNLYMQPLPWHAATFHIRNSSGEAVPGRIYLDSDFPRWEIVPAGGLTVNLPEGTYHATIVPDDEGLMVSWRDLVLTADGELDVWCPPADLQWSEDFEAVDDWTSGGVGDHWHTELDTINGNYGQVLSMSQTPGPIPWPYVYVNDADTWFQYNNLLNTSGGNVAALQFERRGRMDIPADTVFVELSADGQNWQQVTGLCDMDIPWTRTYVNLAEWAAQPFYLRFRLHSDHVLGDVGLYFNDLKLYVTTDNAAPPVPPAVAYSYRITTAYPNPFNPSTTIGYEVAAPGKVQFGIFNVGGQEVRHYDLEVPTAGEHELVWDGANNAGVTLPSGLYFVQLRSLNHVSTHKLLLLR